MLLCWQAFHHLKRWLEVRLKEILWWEQRVDSGHGQCLNCCPCEVPFLYLFYRRKIKHCRGTEIEAVLGIWHFSSWLYCTDPICTCPCFWQGKNCLNSPDDKEARWKLKVQPKFRVTTKLSGILDLPFKNAFYKCHHIYRDLVLLQMLG